VEAYGRHHRGEDDAWNITAPVPLLRERGDWKIDGVGSPVVEEGEEPACG
jgi:hypothetical protein